MWYNGSPNSVLNVVVVCVLGTICIKTSYFQNKEEGEFVSVKNYTD